MAVSAAFVFHDRPACVTLSSFLCSAHDMENTLPPSSLEQWLILEIPFSPSFSLSITSILWMILTRDYFETLLSSLSCITELPLFLPCLVCAHTRAAGFIFLIPEQAELLSCLALPSSL